MREQGNAIAHQILNLEHDGYQHKAPIVRLKTKSISVTITGNVDKNKDWKISENSEQLLVLQQFDNGNETAKVELKN